MTIIVHQQNELTGMFLHSLCTHFLPHTQLTTVNLTLASLVPI